MGPLVAVARLPRKGDHRLVVVELAGVLNAAMVGPVSGDPVLDPGREWRLLEGELARDIGLVAGELLVGS